MACIEVPSLCSAGQLSSGPERSSPSTWRNNTSNVVSFALSDIHYGDWPCAIIGASSFREPGCERFITVPKYVHRVWRSTYEVIPLGCLWDSLNHHSRGANLFNYGTLYWFSTASVTCTEWGIGNVFDKFNEPPVVNGSSTTLSCRHATYRELMAPHSNFLPS